MQAPAQSVWADAVSICARTSVAAPDRPKAADLLLAVQSGDTQTVRDLLAQGANPNARDQLGGARRTAFSLAAQRPDGAEMVHAMWAYGATPFVADRFGLTPLQLAHASTKPLMQAWLNALAPTTSTDVADWQSKAAAGDVAALCAEFNRHRRFNVPGQPGGGLLLRLAARDSDPAVLTIVAEGAAEIDTEGPAGSALVLAISAGQPRSVEILLRAGARPDVPDWTGRTPLLRAAIGGQPDIVGALLVAGANPNQISSIYGSPLIAAARSGHGKAIRSLVSAGANPSRAMANGETPLGAAAAQGHSETAGTLLYLAADPNGRDRAGRPAAMIAATDGDHGLLRALIDAQADLLMKAPDGRSALSVLDAQTSGPVSGPDDSDLKPDLASFPSGLPVDLAEPPTGPVPADPVYPGELDADGGGGILPPINLWIDRQVEASLDTARDELRKIFDVADPDDGLAQQLAQARADQQTLAAQASQLSQAQTQSQATVVRLTREAYSLKVQMDALQAGRAAQRAQVQARIPALRAAMQALLAHRAEVQEIEQRIRSLHTDFMQGTDARYANLRQARERAEEFQIEIVGQQQAFRDARANLRDEVAAALKQFRDAVDERKRRIAEAKSDLTEARSILSDAESLVSKSLVALKAHLTKCGVSNETQQSADGCHYPHPNRCQFMRDRDQKVGRIEPAQSKIPPIRKALSELRALLAAEEQELKVQERLRTADLRAKLARLESDEAELLRVLRQNYARAKVDVSRYRAEFKVERAALEDLANERVTALQANYGPDHERVYTALAQFTATWRNGQPMDADALAGWSQIAAIGEAYDANGRNARGFAAIRDTMASLNIGWSIFALDALEEIALGLELAKTAAAIDETQADLAGIADQLDQVARRAETLVLQISDLQLRRTGADNPSLAEAIRLAEARAQSGANLMREAYRTAAERSLDGAAFASLDAGSAGRLRALTGQDRKNPFLIRLADLLPPQRPADIMLRDPVLDAASATVTPLTADETARLLGSWLTKIDFDATEWRAGTGTTDQSLQTGFQLALASGAAFDAVTFAGHSDSAYRMTTAQGAYWIRADGSLLSFLTRDVAPMFAYTFRTPQDQPSGVALRQSYAVFVAQFNDAFPTLSPQRQSLVKSLEAAFRAVDERKDERERMLLWERIDKMASFVVSSTPLGAYYTFSRVIYDVYKDPGGMSYQEIGVTLLLERWGYKRFDELDFKLLKTYLPNEPDARKEVWRSFIKALLFHRERLESIPPNLSLHAAGVRHANRLRRLLGAAKKMNPVKPASPPAPGARWSPVTDVLEVDFAESVALTRLSTSPLIFAEGHVSEQRAHQLAQCLGIDLPLQPETQAVAGLVLFGVARSVVPGGSACTVIVKP